MNIFGRMKDFITANQGWNSAARPSLYTSATPNVYRVPDSYYQQQQQQQFAPQQFAPQQQGLSALAAYGNQIARGNRAPLQQAQPQALAPQFNLQAALQNAMATRANMQNTGVQVTGDAMRRARAEMAPVESAGSAGYDAGGGGDAGGSGDGDGDGGSGGGDGDGGGDGGDGGGGDGGGERAGGLIMNAAREKALKAYRKGDITFKQLCKALA